jgi:hypothetical protein
VTRPLISARTMATITAIDARAMPSTCTIRHAPAQPAGLTGSGINADGSKSNTAGWTETTAVPCRVTPATREPVEGPLALLPTNIEEFYVSVPVGTVVRTNDQVVVFGTTLDVTAVADLNSYATSVRLNTKRIGDAA